VRAQLFNADGTKLGGELLVNTDTPGFQQDSSVTVLSDGRSLVVWTDDHFLNGVGLAPDVRGQIFNVDGTRAGSEFVLHTPGADEKQPVVAALAGGGFVAAWLAQDDQSIHAQIFDADGRTSGAPLVASPATAGGQSDPVVTALANGDFV